MKTIALCVLLTPVIAGGGLALWPQAPSASLPSPSLRQAAVVALAVAAAQALPPANMAVEEPAPTQHIDLHPAVQQDLLAAEFLGNGRDQMRAVLTNKAAGPLVVRVPAGQMFESDSNSVIVALASEVEVPPGETKEMNIQTAASRSANTVNDAPYRLSFGTMPRLAPLLAHAQEHPELSIGAIQTAVLALSENLPLSSFAKFKAAGSDLETRFDTTSFKTETGDILHALLTLRAIGVQEADLALTIDPQLKIEGMIEPSTRAAAMNYYGITPETEWEYWKTELLSGEPTTRHYALYGIARFFPEVALEMLPKWARETKTQNVFRISAIEALAQTQRPEALPILQRLADEFGAPTELGRAAASAAQFLKSDLAKVAATRSTITFRGAAGMAQF